MRPVNIIIPILLLSTLGLLCILPVQAADDDPCQSLINVYCTRCHTAERICDSLGDTEAVWKATISEMGDIDGDIDQETQSQVLSCVSKMKKGEPAVCKK